MGRSESIMRVRLEVGANSTVSAMIQSPTRPMACFVFAHGAGAGMEHRFMEEVAAGLSSRGIATLRYQFPYMEAHRKRPDRPEIAHATVRAAVAEAALRFGGTRLIAGGKSFGGRMTSQAQAASPMSVLCALAFFGFPLHPAGKPSLTRADHLNSVAIPCLFLQGTADKLADVDLIQPALASFGPLARLHLIPGADHSFHVPKRSGRTDNDVLNEILDVFAEWADELPATEAL
jgi:predicted alpha/beta-hydrolase family hydrolase